MRSLPSILALAVWGAASSACADIVIKGSSPEQIILVQRKLEYLGLEPGPEDGILGEQTWAAITRFCADVDPAACTDDATFFGALTELSYENPDAAMPPSASLAPPRIASVATIQDESPPHQPSPTPDHAGLPPSPPAGIDSDPSAVLAVVVAPTPADPLAAAVQPTPTPAARHHVPRRRAIWLPGCVGLAIALGISLRRRIVFFESQLLLFTLLYRGANRPQHVAAARVWFNAISSTGIRSSLLIAERPAEKSASTFRFHMF